MAEPVWNEVLEVLVGAVEDLKEELDEKRYYGDRGAAENRLAYLELALQEVMEPGSVQWSEGPV